MEQLSILAQLEDLWFSRVKDLHSNYRTAAGRYRDALEALLGTHVLMSAEKARTLQLAAQEEAGAWREYVSALNTFRELVAMGEPPAGM